MFIKKAEKAFLKTYDSSVFEKLSVTTDLLVFSISDLKTNNYRKLSEKGMSVFLTNREQFPFKDCWSLPGGFVLPQETLEETAKRVLREKIHLDDLYLEQLYTFGEIDRDPRMRIISVAYMALVERSDLPYTLQQSDNWFNIIRGNNRILLRNENNPEIELDLTTSDVLAFDHQKIIEVGLDRLKNKIEYTDLAFHLVPNEFTLTELQNVYEAVLGKKLLAPAFRRTIKSKVVSTGNMTSGSGHRPSELYCYKSDMPSNS
ncbi:MAG: NUDIX domain-containing protein [Alphaproteobacteria bacterium]|nr:NUDIX domain-containing protein [Alphaproteobacteria bacterium]